MFGRHVETYSVLFTTTHQLVGSLDFISMPGKSVGSSHFLKDFSNYVYTKFSLTIVLDIP